MNLSEKQLKALAEFVGRTIRGYDGTWFVVDDESTYTRAETWFLSNDGQMALMDAVLDSNEEFTIGKLGNAGYRCMIEGYVLGTVPEATICKGGDSKVVKTRQEALISAVLELLGAKR